MVITSKPRGLSLQMQPRIKSLEKTAVSSGMSSSKKSISNQLASKPNQLASKPNRLAPKQNMLASEKTNQKYKNQEDNRKESNRQEDTITPLSDKDRRRNKTFSILDGSMNSITAGLTSNFIGAFGVALGVSNMTIGMLSTMPHLVGAIVQLLVQKFRKLFGTRRQHIVFFAILQAFMWLPLIFAPQLHNPGPWLILFVTLNTVFGMLIGPVWNSWIGDIIDEDERGRFFGRRNMFTGLTAFVATIMAGWILATLSPNSPFAGFGILFALAFVFRLLSAYYLHQMDDPPEKGLDETDPDPIGFMMNSDKTSLGKFAMFLSLFYISVYISSPFFAVYQLSILKMDYFTFTMIACASAVSSFLTMLWWGKYVDKIGSRNVLVACGFLIPLVPFFWALTTTVWILFTIELFSGLVWAGFNLSVSTYLFDATDRKRRTQDLAEYTLIIQLAVFVGAMIGSAFLGMFDKTDPRAFILIFIVSAMLRLLVITLSYRKLKELRIIEVPIKDRIFKRFVSIRPHHGLQFEPALENRRIAGLMAMKPSKDIAQEIKKQLNKPKPAKIKQMEIKEDEQDTKEYLKKLK